MARNRYMYTVDIIVVSARVLTTIRAVFVKPRLDHAALISGAASAFVRQETGRRRAAGK